MKSSIQVLGLGNQMPPLKFHVTIYFIQKGLTEKEADLFFHQYASVDWRTPKGTPIRNGKVLAADWIWELQQEQKISSKRRNFYLGDFKG